MGHRQRAHRVSRSHGTRCPGLLSSAMVKGMIQPDSKSSPAADSTYLVDKTWSVVGFVESRLTAVEKIESSRTSKKVELAKMVCPCGPCT